MAKKKPEKINEEVMEKLKTIIIEELKKRNARVHNTNLLKKSNGVSREKRRLIGILPSLLLDKKYFPRNDKIAEFAHKKLKIKIPSPHKKKRAELMGRIIEEINKQPSEKILIFSQVFDKLVGKEEKEGITDFFLEWNKAINEL